MSDERLLREYIEEVMLTELSLDRNFINMLKRSAGVHVAPEVDVDNVNMRAVYSAGAKIANQWLVQAERQRGERLWGGKRAQVVRFTVQRFPGIVMRYRGDMDAASRTMYNVLDARFYSLKTGKNDQP